MRVATIVASQQRSDNSKIFESNQKFRHPTRRHLSIALPLLFLPWRGCSEGGFYGTGMQLIDSKVVSATFAIVAESFSLVVAFQSTYYKRNIQAYLEHQEKIVSKYISQQLQLRNGKFERRAFPSALAAVGDLFFKDGVPGIGNAGLSESKLGSGHHRKQRV